MSYTFSRRAFLKYSATTAVAMAGAGLLGGCEFKDPNNPVSKELPSTITSRLQVIASLNTMKIADNTCTLPSSQLMLLFCCNLLPITPSFSTFGRPPTINSKII